MPKISFRVVEFQEANRRGEKFFVEVGVRYTKMVWGFIPWPAIRWEANKEPVSGGDPRIVGHKTFDEALDTIKEIKKQIPKYHRIL